MLFIDHNTTFKHWVCFYYSLHVWMIQLMTLLHYHQPYLVVIKWKSANFDSIPPVQIKIKIEIKIKIVIIITIEIIISIAMEISIKIIIQIIIKMTTTTIQNIICLCHWIHLWCCLHFDTEHWIHLSCKVSSNPLLIWYAFIKLIRLFCWSIIIINSTIYIDIKYSITRCQSNQPILATLLNLWYRLQFNTTSWICLFLCRVSSNYWFDTFLLLLLEYHQSHNIAIKYQTTHYQPNKPTIIGNNSKYSLYLLLNPSPIMSPIWYWPLNASHII